LNCCWLCSARTRSRHKRSRAEFGSCRRSRKQIVRSFPTLICGIPIRSLRTKMNQMQNIAGCRGRRDRVADHAYSDNHVPDAGNRAPSPGVRTPSWRRTDHGFHERCVVVAAWRAAADPPADRAVLASLSRFLEQKAPPGGAFLLRRPLCPANHKWRITSPPRRPADCRRFRESTRPLDGVGKRSVS